MELHVNIDHIATIREARRTFEPSLLEAVKILEATGVAGITMHLREDRRHVHDHDIYEIDEYLRSSRLGLTFEMAATEEIRGICLQIQAKLATIVPEKRQELTTEGGLDLLGQDADKSGSMFDYMREFIKPIQTHGTKVSLFLDPDMRQIEKAKELGADFVELHTGNYANLFAELVELQASGSDMAEEIQAKLDTELTHLLDAASHAKEIGLRVNLGHGLTVDNLLPLLEAEAVEELHIGHSIVANAIFYGLEGSVNKFLALIR